jgi:hypothetical protein
MLEGIAVPAHVAIQLPFGDVGKRGMSQVVRQGEHLHVFLVQVQGFGDGSGHLRDFDGVGQAVPEMVAEPNRKDLCFALQAPEGSGMDDAVAVAREVAAVGMSGLREFPSAHEGRTQAKAVQHPSRSYLAA